MRQLKYSNYLFIHVNVYIAEGFLFMDGALVVNVPLQLYLAYVYTICIVNVDILDLELELTSNQQKH